MRSILIALLMTFATQAGAWIYDDNFALRNTMQMAVSIRDSARGGCWTNLRESREYAEEKLRISGAKVRDKTEFEPNALLGSYYFEIYVKILNRTHRFNYKMYIFLYYQPRIY